MTQIVKAGALEFVCDDPIEVWRAQTWATKEPGTIAWLDTLQPDDVFYDIGANIGIYTLYAAKRCCAVYAFEPHVGNAHALLRNIAHNRLTNVQVVTVALSDRERWNHMEYGSLRVGSSNNQFGRFGPVREWKWSTTVDDFVINAPNPTVIKIDVDGIEADILHGARHVLANGVRSAQVEVGSNLSTIASLLDGFVLVHKHYTAQGQQRIDSGADPKNIVHNAIFEKVPVRHVNFIRDAVNIP